MTTPARITQRDIARRAGVTQATVSLALRGHASIPVATRERIKQIVGELGYQPDPYLSGLAVYRQQSRVPSYHATLAWVSNFPVRGGWRYWPVFVGYFEGASQRASELGYKLEEFCPQADSMSRQRLEQILTTRNISGILLPPQPTPRARLEDFPWSKFSVVTFGYSLEFPQLNVVTLDHFRCIEAAFDAVSKLGYRRPGLALSLESDRRSDNMLSAAFWSIQRGLPAKDRIPSFQPPGLDAAGLLAWYRKHRPDVIFSIHPEVYHWLVDAGVEVPRDVGVVSLSIPDEKSNLSGICEHAHLTGARAVEALISMIYHGERGVPEIPVRIMIQGSWVPGNTCASRPVPR